MLVLPKDLRLSRTAWLLLVLFTLSVNALLCWAIVNLSEPQQNLKMTRKTQVSLVDTPQMFETIIEESTHPEVKTPLASLIQPLPPIATHLPSAPDFVSQIVIPNLTSEPLFSDLTALQPTTLYALESLKPVFSPPVLATSPTLQIAPLYPSTALARNIEGWVVLEFSVDGHGSPYAIQVIDENPSGYFKQATLKAFTRWHFPVEPNIGSDTRYQYTVTYKIDK